MVLISLLLLSFISGCLFISIINEKINKSNQEYDQIRLAYHPTYMTDMNDMHNIKNLNPLATTFYDMLYSSTESKVNNLSVNNRFKNKYKKNKLTKKLFSYEIELNKQLKNLD